MQVNMKEAIVRVRRAGNGAHVVIPLAGGQALKVSYLWKKVRVDFCTLDGKIVSPARRGRGGRIAAITGTTVGEGAATPAPPLPLALGDEFLPLAGDTHDNPD